MKKILDSLDSPGGHIMIGCVLVYTLIACKYVGIDGGIENLLAGLIGLSLGRSLQKTSDGI